MKNSKYIFIIIAVVIGTILMGSPCFGSDEGTVFFVQEAMQDELRRSMKSLKMENMEKPYYIQYTVLDTRELTIAAQFGALTKADEIKKRTLKVGLRVGDYTFDNSEFIDKNSFRSSFGRPKRITIENDYNNIRHDIWLATDQAYKNALEELSDKKAYIKTNVQSEEVPDFSKAEKGKSIITIDDTMKVDKNKWEQIAVRLSGILRRFPAINASGVELTVWLNYKYYVNSEGMFFVQPEKLAALSAYATTQAADGMKLKHHVPFYAETIDGLPAEKVLAAGIEKMAEELTALTKAPVLKEYIGPVLFSGQASAELFTQLLAPHFSGQRPPLSNMPRMSAAPSKLARRMNRAVLPRDISITADPTIADFQKTSLIGSYKVDDQGVPAAPVKLVEKGVLKTLLMSRRPRKDIPKSNGHARSNDRGKVGVHLSNLIISSEKGKPYKELKAELIDLCKDQQAPFGLLVKTVDNEAITGKELSFSFFSRGSQGPKLSTPVMVYKVYVKDGREELVRGVSFGDINVKSFRDILAAGNDYYVHNRLLNSGGGMFAFLMGGRSTGIPGAVVAPSVLFEELELKKSSEGIKKPPLAAHPFFAK